MGDLGSATAQTGAGLLWVHSRNVMISAGFSPGPGATVARTDPCSSGGEELPVLPGEVVLGLLPRTFTPIRADDGGRRLVSGAAAARPGTGHRGNLG